MPCVQLRPSTSRLGTFSSLSATARPPSAPNSLPAHITHCCSSSASSSTAGQSNQNRSRYDRVTRILFTLETNRRIWIQSSHGKSQNKSCSLYSVSLALAAWPSILFCFQSRVSTKAVQSKRGKKAPNAPHASEVVLDQRTEPKSKEQVTHPWPREREREKTHFFTRRVTAHHMSTSDSRTRHRINHGCMSQTLLSNEKKKDTANK